MMNGSRLAGIARVSLVAGLCLVTAEVALAHTVRGHSTHRGSHVGVRWGGWYGPYYSYWYTPYYGYYGYYPPYPRYGYEGGAYAPREEAFIDTDIQPEETGVFLDGEYAGTVDDFDGFPDYLSITPGRHTLTFKAEGYKTVTRSVRVPRGALLELDFSLSRGTGEQEEIAGDKNPEIAVPEPEADSEEGDRPPEQQGRIEMEEEPGADEEGPGFIRLSVTPTDASVYLDGEFLGTASRVSRLHGDLRLEPGEHRIEVVRPGYRGVKRVVKISAGDRQSLDLDLERTGSGAEPK